MKTFLACVPCFVHQTLSASCMATDDVDVQTKVMRKVLEELSAIDFSCSPPEMAKTVHSLIREISGNSDPYAEIKHEYNQKALLLYPQLKEEVRNSKNPLETAVRIAIAGNYIDFGAFPEIDEIILHEIIENTLHQELAVNDMSLFVDALDKAERIFYLADNSGEIVFDRILIEELGADRVTCAVRGFPVLNDVTMKDAVETGLTDIVKVIGNGGDFPGTVLSKCSDEFRDEFNKADLVISKGQGNYETLSSVKKNNLFFLLKVKCKVIADNMGYKTGGSIFMKA
ncbi:MAG: DUF89 family protein [Alphaproteobacteria bacterium]|nr:DUF89 family protein [Alphaproteobacteria bacterium]